ncbi:DNA polymerase III subunit delta [Mycoplasmopsis gallinarum]|uniref:DNA polymerase III subunit delta n=1 Tax=Mycoplasmopsis gallinarum TaxID=29557 RepID=UPI000485E7B4|nr:hypothetical protein [Mycoplasmopsis gallinarum]
MHLIIGDSLFLINHKIKQIKETKKIKDLEKIDCSENFDLNDLFLATNSNSLFNETKIVAIWNFPYFVNKIAETVKKDLLSFIQQIENNENEIIFVIPDLIELNKLNNNFFTKFILENAKIIEIKIQNERDLSNLIIDYVISKKGTIDFLASKLLIEKLNGNIDLIINEINKLLLLNPLINSKAIENSVQAIIKDDPFALVNALKTNDFSTIWKKYKEQLSLGSEINLLISQIAQTLILAHQIYGYSKVQKKLEDLARDQKINLYRLKNINYLLKNLGISKIKNLLKDLAKLDLNIKKGIIDAKIGFERLLIKNFY